jgi:uncharacterized protein YndB with AHSA1/START domain
MFTTKLLVPLVVLTLAACASTPPPVAKPAPKVAVPPPAALPEMPALLVGTWQGEHNGVTTVERWWRPHDDLMVGLNRTLQQGQETGREHLQIHRAGDQIIYTAWPQGQPVTRFKMTRATPRVEFENPEHDFPRLISYGMDGDKLAVQIQGIGQDDQPQSASWSWDRAKDPPAGPAPIRLTAQVSATPAQVYAAWTTTSGVQGFFTPAALVETRQGGRYEMYFMKDAPAGKRGSDDCVLVLLDPPRKVAFTWNFPPSIPTLRDAHTLVTLEFKAASGGTQIDMIQTGFQAGEDWNKGREYFQAAWKTVLDSLTSHFNKQAATVGK